MPMVTACRRCGALQAASICAACAEVESARRYANEENYRKRGRGGYYQTSAWRRLSAACIERDGRACVYCGGVANLVAHHLIPRKQGGVDRLSNLATLCGECHAIIEADLRAGRDTNIVRTLDLLIHRPGK